MSSQIVLFAILLVVALLMLPEETLIAAFIVPKVVVVPPSSTTTTTTSKSIHSIISQLNHHNHNAIDDDDVPNEAGDVIGKARRSFLVNTLPAAVFAAGSFSFVGNSRPALAKYGDSTNIELPSYIDFLIEKNSVVDETKVLYKGADPSVLLKRLQEANAKLTDIPTLAEQKKWSQIQGILTGPLGTFSQTLNQIATATTTPSESSSSRQNVDAAVKKLKTDLIEIGQAANQKNGPLCGAKSRQATQDLESFVKAAFE